MRWVQTEKLARLEIVQRGDLAALQALDLPWAEVVVVDPHGTQKTLLHVVVDWPGHYPHAAEKIPFLTRAGVPVDAPAVGVSEARETGLHWAASADDVVAIDALIAAGADLEAPGAVLTGGTPMADAVVFQQWSAAQRLLDHGATVTGWQAAALGLDERLAAHMPQMDQRAKNAALWHACRAGHGPCLSRLLAAGADPDWRGPMDKTPREVAAKAVVELL